MIQLKEIEKKFDKSEVLKNLSFDIEPGKITAIVGPNGSGKTTIIKTILGLVKPDNGDILIDDKSILNDYHYRKNIGYMPQSASFPENLTIREVLKMIGDLRNSKIKHDDELLVALNLTAEMNKQVKTLSGGTKQKVSALLSLMFNPSIIILDEPTAGLDPVASSNLKELIIKEKMKGKTIILTSHIMSEIEELADHIIFLIEGKIKFDGSVFDLLTYKSENKLEKVIANMMNEKSAWN
ncbi:MAG TPA: copper ABC transporter ATP-binding protein [Ignavibacteriales bacterium]|nr:copper ABC transporter ATP-binding protein [Ignavibacteriales bacterium]